MTADYLSNLAFQLDSQYGVGATQTNALNILQDGHNRQYKTLGGFARKLDQTQGRKYVEDGFLRYDPFNVTPKAFEVLMQEPDMTLLVKKRAFSTLAENHRMDYADADEKLFYKATKILFQNKCKQIAALEKLSKISRVSDAAGYLDEQLVPIIISLVDEVSPGFSNSPLAEENSFLDSQQSEPFKKLTSVIDKIRKVWAFSGTNYNTTWITDDTNIFKSDFSQGTGVIEITNVTNIRTTTSLGLTGGAFSFQISDPYKSMAITNSDIEFALLDALNAFNNSAVFQLGKSSLDQVAADTMQQLNNARQSRGASPIEFILNPENAFGTQVTAIIENIGEAINFTYNPIPNLSAIIAGGGITVSPESLRGGPIVEDAGLDPITEVPLFTIAVNSLYNSIQFKQTSQSNIVGKSKLTNYARNKLRLHYGGKNIIQEMDQVHVYMGSKSRTDDRLITGLQGMFNGLGFLQGLNNSVYNLKNQVNTLFNPSQNIDLQLEKTIYVGNNFPTALWVMLRNLFINDKNGAHVFGGVVESSERGYNEGRWVISVGGRDNSAYLNYGVVNLKPGVDQFNGSLYDPLTPFETRFDAVTSNFKNNHPKLLAENQAILNNQTPLSGLMRFKSGRNAGQIITADNLFEDKEIPAFGIARDIYYAPDGFVYKWKEGIGMLVQFGDSFSRDNIDTVGIPITGEPLAGQDIMNVLSLYITGIPYNYATYYKAVADFDTLGRNPQSGISGAASFYTGITNSLKRNNLLWGDFIPFKNLVVDEQTFLQTLNTTLTINNSNAQIDQLLQQIQDSTNKLYILQSGGAKNDPTTTSLQNQLTSLNAQLANQRKAVANTLMNSNTPLTVVGNDVSYNPDQLLDSQSFSLSSPEARREVRRRINFLTRRVQWQVRANDDKNLFIVDDSYDKDYDIAAFNKLLVGQIAQYSTEFQSVAEKVSQVAKLLNLEVFCDTQGHIRARPQQYNRMPSSVFYRMLQLKQQTGIQIFPQFLEDLFAGNIKSLIQQIKVIEDQIRLDGAILGLNNDGAVVKFIQSPAVNKVGNADFHFVSDDVDGVITDISGILDQNNPDTTTSNDNNTFIHRLKAQNAVNSIYSVTKRASTVQAILSPTTSINTTLSSDRINSLKTRLQQESGQQVTLDNFQLTSINSVIATPTNQVDAVKLTNDLAQKLSQRQQLIKQAAGVIKNAKEAKSLDSGDNNTANQLLFPDLYGNKDVPEIFANMIEDESFDDYGPGSGQRYVIHNYQIRSYTVKEVPPDFTAIEVQGMFDLFIDNGTLPQGLASFPGGGNGMITAAAVDYDLWRMYGYRNQATVSVPFLSDPQGQCAPYAASLLSRARRNILRASLTIAGNEYMQPGEVVYIEDEDLLFYVESVSHDFTYGSSFTTSMELSYGHTPGEYIPTPLDVIGKMLYKTTAPAGTSFVNYRQSNVFNESPLGAILVNTTAKGTNGILAGNYGEANHKIINNIMYWGSSITNQNTIAGSNVAPSIELRVFYDSKQGNPDSNIVTQVDNLKTILTGGNIDTTQTNTNTAKSIDASFIITGKDAQIDISNADEYRSPSQQAWDLARNAMNSASVAPPAAITDAQQTQQTIFTTVIDCVMVFTNANNAANTGNTANTNNNAAPSNNTTTTTSTNTSSVGNFGPGF